MPCDDPQQLVWPNHCSHTSGKCFPFVLCSIIYALPAGFHPVTWQANVHKGVPVTIAQMSCCATGSSCKTRVAQQPACSSVIQPLNVYPSPKFPLVAPRFCADWNLLSQRATGPCVRPTIRYVHALWSRQSLSSANCSIYSWRICIITIVSGGFKDDEEDNRLMRIWSSLWKVFGCVWVSPSLDFHRCYLFSFLPDQPHLPTPRFSIDNISYTFSIPGHMALFFLQAGYA